MKDKISCEKRNIYLDHAATTSIRKEVIEIMESVNKNVYGNPGSFHNIGLKAKKLVDQSRKMVADCLNVSPNEIIFTSGGTESINLAIKGLAMQMKKMGKNHIITTQTEHHAVLHTCEYLEKNGFEVTYLKVDKEGFVDLDVLRAAIKDTTFLVSVMYANNELGTVQDILGISRACKGKKVLFHTDACQAAGYLDLNVENLGIDLMSINSSKVYGPKGVGALYVKRRVSLEPILHGGGQERNLRSGTENVSGIVGFANSLNLACEEKEKEVLRLVKLRDKLIDGILEKVPKTMLNGPLENRLPNNVNIAFLDVEGESLLLHLNEKGIYVSTGSACTSKTLDPSHVIIAMGIPYGIAHSSIRFTLGRETSESDINYVLEVLPDIVKSLRNISPFNTDIGGVVEHKK